MRIQIILLYFISACLLCIDQSMFASQPNQTSAGSGILMVSGFLAAIVGTVTYLISDEVCENCDDKTQKKSPKIKHELPAATREDQTKALAQEHAQEIIRQVASRNLIAVRAQMSKKKLHRSASSPCFENNSSTSLEHLQLQVAHQSAHLLNLEMRVKKLEKGEVLTPASISPNVSPINNTQTSIGTLPVPAPSLPS